MNLVINGSVKNIKEIRNFYGKLENLYAYFANSIERWAHLKFVSFVAISLKRLYATRWCFQNDCLKAFSLLYVDILKLLAYSLLMSQNKKEKASGFQKCKVFVIITVETKIQTIC